MKKSILLFIIGFAFLFSATEQEFRDSTVTKIPESAIRYYNIQEQPSFQNKDFSPYKDPETRHPFALVQPKDSWFSFDKWMHLSTSYFIVLQSHYVLNRNFRFPENDAKHISVGLCLTLSLGKEFYDVYGKKGIFSWKDLFYDILGCSLGYLTLQLID